MNTLNKACYYQVRYVQMHTVLRDFNHILSKVVFNSKTRRVGQFKHSTREQTKPVSGCYRSQQCIVLLSPLLCTNCRQRSRMSRISLPHMLLLRAKVALCYRTQEVNRQNLNLLLFQHHKRAFHI